MTLRYPGDGETDQIGKLVDNGHPRLAFAAICVRNLRRMVVIGCVTLMAIYAPTALDHIRTVIATSE